MPVLIVTHPHAFDNGVLKGRLPEFVKQLDFPVYFIRDGKKKPYGGKNLYDGELKPDDRLGKVGRASLRDNPANKVVSGNRNIFLAGGNLSECLASTYNSLVRAAEREKEKVNIVLLEDLIYAQDKKNGEVGTMVDVAKSGQLDKYMQLFQESGYVERGMISSERVLKKV